MIYNSCNDLKKKKTTSIFLEDWWKCHDLDNGVQVMVFSLILQINRSSKKKSLQELLINIAEIKV